MTNSTTILHQYIACGYTDLYRGIDGLAALLLFSNQLYYLCKVK